jgi:hypothetical protein
MRALRFAFLTTAILTAPALALGAQPAHHANYHRPVKRVVHSDPGFTVAIRRSPTSPSSIPAMPICSARRSASPT